MRAWAGRLASIAKHVGEEIVYAALVAGWIAHAARNSQGKCR